MNWEIFIIIVVITDFIALQFIIIVAMNVIHVTVIFIMIIIIAFTDDMLANSNNITLVIFVIFAIVQDNYNKNGGDSNNTRIFTFPNIIIFWL